MHQDLKIKDTRKFHHDNPDIVTFGGANWKVIDSLYRNQESGFKALKYEQIPSLEYIYTIARRSQIRIPTTAQSLRPHMSEDNLSGTQEAIFEHDYQSDNKKILQKWIDEYNKICDEINEMKNDAKQGLDGDTE